jgi:hypothetical protein
MCVCTVSPVNAILAKWVGYWNAYKGQPMARFDKENEIGTACIHRRPP